MNDPRHSNHSEDYVSLTSDPIVLVDFYTAKPRIMLVRRKYEPYKGMLVFAGGHFTPGKFNPQTQTFEGGDPSLAHVTSREAEEEARFLHPWHVWKFFTVLDRPDRDPRSDVRRISIPMRTHLNSSNMDDQAIIDNLQAGDDAASVHLIPLMELTMEDMGFDHWTVISMLQDQWEELRNTWRWNDEKKIFEHHCPQSSSDTTTIYWNKELTTAIMMLKFVPHTKITFNTEINYCTYCGADLTFTPFAPQK